jgi:hypothetical protein
MRQRGICQPPPCLAVPFQPALHNIRMQRHIMGNLGLFLRFRAEKSYGCHFLFSSFILFGNFSKLFYLPLYSCCLTKQENAPKAL